MDLQKILNSWNIKCDVNSILNMWNESHRHYHTLDHLNEILKLIESDKRFYTEKEYEKLIITTLFHDCIYDPLKNDNEEKSASFFEKCCLLKNEDLEHITNMILETKNHKSSTKLSESFIDYDMSIINSDFDRLLYWEDGIYNEYKSHGDDSYKIGRLSFLESLLDNSKYIDNTENLLKLIDYVKSKY